jgi:hypothetical protein
MRRFASLALCSLLAACGGGGDAADAGPIDAAPPGGTFALAWTIEDLESGALACDDVAGASIAVTGVPLDAVVGFNEIFSCGSGEAVSAEVEPGRYNLSLDLLTAQGDSLLSDPIELPTIEIERGVEADAGSATFAVDPTGNLTFTIDVAGDDGDNCASDPEDGATIDQAIVEVADADGDCVDGMIFVFGDEDAEYVTHCEPPAQVDCIRDDVAMVATAQRSGRYTLTVSGTKLETGGEVCYTAEPVEIVIPGNGLTLEEDPIVLESSDAEACTPPL